MALSYKASGSSVATTVVNTNLGVTSSGGVGTAKYSLSVAPGTYDVSIKVGHWLAKKLTGVDLTAGDYSSGNVTFVNGDINGDNAVNFSDYLILKANYKKTGDTL